MFPLVNIQKFALVTVVEIIAGQPAVGRWTAGVQMVFGPASYVLWVEQRNKCFVVWSRVISEIL